MIRTYGFSIVFSLVCVGLAGWWGMNHGMGVGTALWLVLVLGVLEISLSFDNAVVNASVLKGMTPFWQKMFLTIGILIAVFGMRLVFPVVIVAGITGLDMQAVIDMALQRPDEYGKVLTDAYPMIATFGGSFLLMVFLHFLMDAQREEHWLGAFDARMAKLGHLDSVQVFIALVVVLGVALSMAEELKYKVLLAGVSGVMLYVAISVIDDMFQKGMANHLPENANNEPALLSGKPTGLTEVAGKAGFSAFLYLEVLDASFSFDGVIGAFAITRDVVIIMLGLAIGAIFVRSITIDLVKRGTLQQYRYLEHGAHYAIGVLAAIMFIGTHVHVPEAITGLIGVAFIVASVWSSVRANRREAK